MEWVLEKQLQQPLQLFKIIWKADNTYIGLNDVMSQTGWTPYMVNRVLTDVSDIYHSMTALYSGVLLSEGNILNIANLQKVQYTDLMAYLFKRSLAVSILIDIFFERVTSNEGIAQRYASSKNTIRQMKNDLNRKLETIGLSISKDYKIVGNERTIRLFFFNIFYTSYVDDQFPFNSLVRQQAIQVELILRRTANTQLTIKIPVGDVGVDGTVTKTVKVRVDKNEDTTLINTAEATGSNYYVNPVTLPSNDVRVNVKKTEFTKPVKLTMTDQIVDETYPDSHNATQTEVDDVAGGDKIDYTITVANTAAQSKFTGGKLTFDVPKDATINSLVVNDMPIPAGWYENKATANGQQIGITDIDLISGDTLAIKVNLTLPKKVTFDRYTTTPKIVGNDTDQSAYTATGDPLTMVVADDTISFTPQDINFGAHPTLQAGMVLDRTAETTAPNAVVKISDERRTKTPVSVTVKAVEPFREIDNSTAQLPAHLLFYHGSAADAVTQGVEIAKTTDGQTLTDVVWQQNEGLRLHVDGSTNQPGEYRTQLEWQVNMGY
ncbi:helix-turn-helix domain-containing protein [Weissella cibaria]|uniref:helix-turn-helix domain-containing protein n=2 Tax=Weissella cibaria TaxID=137591 RepID=UPI001193CA59|nr:helix-turn-helix domain-containing protein [Weissella cibaria]TVV31539.1 helix-turn-helix domain-containing protein [Weissella cibaria]